MLGFHRHPSDSQSLNETVRRIAASTFGADPVSAHQVTRGVMTFKSIVEMPNGGEYIVRIYPEGRDHIVDFEPDLMRLARTTGVLAPEVIADSRSDPLSELSYVVYRLIPGSTLDEAWPTLSEQRLRRLTSQIAENIELLTSIEVSGWGSLRSVDKAQYPTWAEFLQSSINAGLRAIQIAPHVCDSLGSKLRAVTSHCSRLAACAHSTIAWSDISPENIIVSCDGELAGFIDFEGMLSGDHLLTFGYLKAKYHRTEFFDRIMATMMSDPDPLTSSKINFFAVLRGLRLLRHVNQPLPNGTRRLPLEEAIPGFEPALDELLTQIQE